MRRSGSGRQRAPGRRRLGRGKFLVFAAAAIVLSGTLALAAVACLDAWLHQRFERAAGLNVRGYRGPLVKRKQPGEQRLVVLGGSAAFGYGVLAHEALPAALERALNARRRPAGLVPVSVVNLAYNREGAYAAVYTLKDYDDLDYDAAVLYTGYNDLGEEPNRQVFRHGSLVFRLTGYYPILPIVVREKWMALRHGGNLEAAYRAAPVIFRPEVGSRQGSARRAMAAEIRQALERHVGRLTARGDPAASIAEDCGERWAHYCQAVAAVVASTLDRGKASLVVTEPYLSDEHVAQQAAMARMLETRFGDQPRVRQVNLGRGVVDLQDPALCLDGVHLTAAGNARVAHALLEPIEALLQNAN